MMGDSSCFRVEARVYPYVLGFRSLIVESLLVLVIVVVLVPGVALAEVAGLPTRPALVVGVIRFEGSFTSSRVKFCDSPITDASSSAGCNFPSLPVATSVSSSIF